MSHRVDGGSVSDTILTMIVGAHMSSGVWPKTFVTPAAYLMYWTPSRSVLQMESAGIKSDMMMRLTIRTSPRV